MKFQISRFCALLPSREHFLDPFDIYAIMKFTSTV